MERKCTRDYNRKVRKIVKGNLLEHREAVQMMELIVKRNFLISGSFQPIENEGLFVAGSNEFSITVGWMNVVMIVLVMARRLLWNWLQSVGGFIFVPRIAWRSCKGPGCDKSVDGYFIVDCSQASA